MYNKMIPLTSYAKDGDMQFMRKGKKKTKKTANHLNSRHTFLNLVWN